jgi:ribosomal protein S18 acetylase RimI-like enzyme
MVEIRRIRADEAERVTKLWDDACRAVPGGAPLSERGRRNIARMLRAAAEHPEIFCLVATVGGAVVGYTVGRVSGHPVLPGLEGELEDLYVVPAARERSIGGRLADAAIARLRDAGAGVISIHVDADDEEAQAFWTSRGFEGDTVRFALYPG